MDKDKDRRERSRQAFQMVTNENLSFFKKYILV